jgi:hypothetical protein
LGTIDISSGQGIIERVYNCEFDGLITTTEFNSIENSEIDGGLTVSGVGNFMPPSGMFHVDFAGTFTGPANSARMDLSTDYFFRTNGASLAGGATKVILSPVASSSVDGILSSTDWTIFNNKKDKNLNVIDGGDANYSIQTTDDYVRSTTALTADRTYTLPACVANIGEVHDIKNKTGQTFNIILEGDGTDTIEGSLNQTLNPGDSLTVVCAVAGEWDIK